MTQKAKKGDKTKMTVDQVTDLEASLRFALETLAKVKEGMQTNSFEIRITQSEKVLSVFSMLINDPLQSIPRLVSENATKKKAAPKKAGKKARKPSRK